MDLREHQIRILLRELMRKTRQHYSITVDASDTCWILIDESGAPTGHSNRSLLDLLLEALNDNTDN